LFMTSMDLVILQEIHKFLSILSYAKCHMFHKICSTSQGISYKIILFGMKNIPIA